MNPADASLPERFGGSWDQFVASWCLGHAPAYEQRLVVAALRAVDEFCPECINQTTYPSSRGLYRASPVIELGRLLCLVRNCEGFDELVPRLRHGTQGAHAELITAGALVQAGLPVRFGAHCEGHVLDLAIEGIPGGPVYVEVTAPLRSEDAEERNRLVLELTDHLRAAGHGFTIMIEFLDEPTRETVDALVSSVPSEESGAWVSLGDAVRFRRVAAWPAESADFMIQWPDIDRRTELIVRRKCAQLSREHCNVIAIDMSAVGGSEVEWVNAIRRLLQPTKNRRIGAVVLYASLFSAHLTRGYRLWWVVVNPYATRPVPEALLQVLRELDETELLLA